MGVEQHNMQSGLPWAGSATPIRLQLHACVHSSCAAVPQQTQGSNNLLTHNVTHHPNTTPHHTTYYTQLNTACDPLAVAAAHCGLPGRMQLLPPFGTLHPPVRLPATTGSRACQPAASCHVRGQLVPAPAPLGGVVPGGGRPFAPLLPSPTIACAAVGSSGSSYCCCC